MMMMIKEDGRVSKIKSSAANRTNYKIDKKVNIKSKNQKRVYSIKGTSTISTLDSTSLLVGVNVGELATGSLDDLDTVGTGGERVLTTVG